MKDAQQRGATRQFYYRWKEEGHKDEKTYSYGIPIKETNETACVAWLMRLYQQKVGEQV